MDLGNTDLGPDSIETGEQSVPQNDPNRFNYYLNDQLQYVSDTFVSPSLANLDLYLMPAGATDISQNVWSSIGTDYNIEHIFYELDAPSARYELWVRQVGGAVNPNFALAWWGEEAPAADPSELSG